MSSCPVRLSYRDGQPNIDYEATELVDWLETSFPRLGGSNDLVNDWMRQDTNGMEDRTGYVVGITSVAMVVTGILWLWALGLWACTRAGPTRVGLVSGRVPPKTNPPTPRDLEEEDVMEPTLDAPNIPLQMSEEDEEDVYDYDPDMVAVEQAPPREFPETTVVVQPGEDDISTLNCSLLPDDGVSLPTLNTPDKPPPPNESSETESATPVSKHSEYIRYLQEAITSKPVLTENGASESFDSDDWLLDGILAEKPDIKEPEKPETPTETPPPELDMSFPLGTEEGFLFEDNSDEDIVLPHSKYTSQAASRKRQLESYVESLKNSRSVLVTDDSTMVDDTGIVIRDTQKKMYAPILQSGTPPTDDSSSSEDEFVCNPEPILDVDFQRQQLDWWKLQRRKRRRLQQFRIAVILAATLLIVSSLLLAMNGIWNLDWQRQNVEQAWHDLPTLQLQTFVQELQSLQGSVSQQLWNLWQLLDQHCPPVTFCNATSCNVTGLPLESQWREWLQVIVDPNHVQTELQDDWDAVVTDLNTLQDQPVESTLQWYWALWGTVACNSFLTIMVLSILAGMSLPDSSPINRYLGTWSFAIFYWLLVGLGWIFAVCFLVGMLVTADACSESTVDVVAKELVGRLETESFLPDYWNYYLEGCPADGYPTYVDDRVWDWASLLPPTTELAHGLEAFSAETFEETCGTSIEPLRQAAETLNLQLCMVTQSLSNIRRVLGCDQWHPSYERIAYESTCTQTPNALLWATGTQVVVVLMAFMIWMCRVAFLVENQSGTEVDSNGCCLRPERGREEDEQSTDNG